MLELNLNKWLEFNRICPLCDIHTTDQQGICKHCANDLPYFQTGCPICALPASDGICNECQTREAVFKWATAGFTYRFPIPQLIHRIKTGKDPEPLHWLSNLLACRIGSQLPQEAYLVPVPMHPIDHLMRGFNQSEILARNLSKKTGLRLNTRLIQKYKRSPKQARLDRLQRTQNLKDCFKLTEKPPAEIVLIDDVMTTGTTLRRISELLLSAGCQRIGVCVLCRTPSD